MEVKTSYILKGDYIVCRDERENAFVEEIRYRERDINTYNRNHFKWFLKTNKSWWRAYNKDGEYYYHEHQCDIIDVLRDGKSIFYNNQNSEQKCIFTETKTKKS